MLPILYRWLSNVVTCNVIFLHAMIREVRSPRLAFALATLAIALLSTQPSAAQETADVDSIAETIELPTVRVQRGRQLAPLTTAERQAYWRRVRDVKKTLPYAKYVAATVIETYEFVETLPESEQEAHLRRVERELKTEMEPKMRALTLSQGKVLIKLINRQSGSSSYTLVKAFLGGWRAWWWNQFAKFTGADLRSEYHPESDPDDAVTERIVQLVEAGYL